MTHLYQVKAQPATDWIDNHGDVPMRLGFAPAAMLWCWCCKKKHPARDCVVHSYYDQTPMYCAPGKGCNDPLIIEQKKARATANRSAGQRARHGHD